MTSQPKVSENPSKVAKQRAVAKDNNPASTFFKPANQKTFTAQPAFFPTATSSVNKNPGVVIQTKRTAGQSSPDSAAGGDKECPIEISSLPDTAGIQRDLSSDMTGASDQAQQQQQAEMQAHPPPAAQVTNVSDMNSARSLAQEIEGYRSNMEAGARDGNISGPQLGTNENVTSSLNDYLFMGGEQNRTLSNFQTHVSRVRINYARLMAQVDVLRASGRVESGVEASETGRQIIQAGGFSGAAAMQSRLSQIQDPTVALLLPQVQAAHETMNTAQERVGTAADAAQAAVFDVRGQADELTRSIQPAAPDPALDAELRDIRARADRFKQWVGRGLEALQTAAAATPAGVAVSALPGATAVAGAAREGLVDLMSEAMYGEQIEGIQGLISAFNQRHVNATISANTNRLRSMQATLSERMRDFTAAQRQFNSAQENFRTILRNFGSRADQSGGGGNRFSLVANVLAEADPFVIQCDAAIQLGQTEESTAASTSNARHRLEGVVARGGSAGQPSMVYYRPYQVFHIRQGHLSYEALENTVSMRMINTDEHAGSAEGPQHGVNPVVHQSMQELQQYRNEVSVLRASLASGLGLNMGPATPNPAAP